MTRDKPDTGWAWAIVIGVTIINLAVLPVQQGFGLIFSERFANLGITATQTSLILHLNGTITCSLGLISGPMMKRFSCRKVAFFGGLTVVLGNFVTAFAISLPTIIFSYCVIIGIGQGIVFPATTLALNTYFRKKRNIAMGFTVTMTALGPIVMPLLIVKLLETYATTGALIIIAGIATNSFVGASLLRPFRAGKENGDGNPKDNRDDIVSSLERLNNDAETSNAEDSKFKRIPDVDLENCIVECRLINSSEYIEEHNSKKLDEEQTKKSLFTKISENLDLDLLQDNRYILMIV